MSRRALALPRRGGLRGLAPECRGTPITAWYYLRPAPPAPAQLACEEAVEQAVTDRHHAPVLRGEHGQPIRDARRSRVRGRNRFVRVTPSEAPRQPRDDNPDAWRQCQRDSKRLGKNRLAKIT